jgi:oxygen-independent coproporphyrinogen-3 oxidase
MKLKNGFLEALLNEIFLQKHFLDDEVVETIYFGGGTPSLMEIDEISRIITALKQTFLVDINAEVTLEANPDDINPQKLDSWNRIKINRLSIGVQSFFDDDLKWMNRAHNAEQSERCIVDAQKAGFNNLSIDLIYGNPTLSEYNWHQNVDKAVSLGIPHLSCYALTVEPKTALEKMINNKMIEDVSQDSQARHLLLLMDWLNTAGYEQYEISNYALPGKQSKHNSSYWRGTKYLGLGPSAHSFNGNARQWNVPNNALYIESLKNNKIPFEIEWLTPIQKLNEWIMTSLRTKQGVQLDSPPIYNKALKEKLKKKSVKYQTQSLLYEEEESLRLTTEGKLFADGIAAALFFEENEIS